MTLPPVGAPGAPSPPSPTRAVTDAGQSASSGRRFIDVWEEGRQPPPLAPTGRQPAVLPAAPPAPPSASSASGPARTLLESALRSESKIDALLAAAGKGKTFSAAELLAMQATVFRYSQTVEVVSRAADRLVGAIKQTLGTQV